MQMGSKWLRLGERLVSTVEAVPVMASYQPTCSAALLLHHTTS
jgi:hypothetical protein